MTVSPNDEELIPTIQSLRRDNLTLGIPKFHALLLSHNPDWTVSEKRVKKLLTQIGMGPNNLNGSTRPGRTYPMSKMNDMLKVDQWTSKVKVHYFGKEKGKGLVAVDDIAEGEEIWKEDPFIIAAETEIWDNQRFSLACAHCTSSLVPPSALHKECNKSNSGCRAMFCSSLCKTRSSAIHPLLCLGSNPAVGQFFSWAKEIDWMAPRAFAQCVARILLAYEKDPDGEDYKEVKNFYESMAGMSLEQRSRDIGLPLSLDLWEKGFEMFNLAFRKPTEEGKLKKVIKRPLLPSTVPALFSFEQFLLGLGKMSLNLEAHGGIYVLHFHLNHSCDPNISVRHLQQRTTLSRITVIARREIKKGEELLISYVNPNMDAKFRRQQLKEWNWGLCKCPRCVKEEKEVWGASEAGVDELFKDDPSAMPGLEQELKEGLGLHDLMQQFRVSSLDLIDKF